MGEVFYAYLANFSLFILIVYLYLIFLSFGDRDGFEIKHYTAGDEDDPYVEQGSALKWAVWVKNHRQKSKISSIVIAMVLAGAWLGCAFTHGRTTAAGGGTVLGAVMVIGFWWGFWGWIGNEGLNALEHSMHNTHKSRWGRAWNNVADKGDAWIMLALFLVATFTFGISGGALVVIPNATGITLPLSPATEIPMDPLSNGILMNGTSSGLNASSTGRDATFNQSSIAPYIYNATCLMRKGGHELLQRVDKHAVAWLDNEFRVENVLGEALVSFVILMALCLASIPLPTTRVGRFMWRIWMFLVVLQLLLSLMSLIMVVVEYVDAHSAFHSCMLTTKEGLALFDFVMLVAVAFYPPVASKLALVVAHSGLLVEGMRVADVVEKRWNEHNYGPKGCGPKWLLPFRLAKYDNGHGQGFGARVSLNMFPNVLICTCLTNWIVTISCVFSVVLLPVGFVVFLGLYGVWTVLRALHHCATRQYQKHLEEPEEPEEQQNGRHSVGSKLFWLQVRGIFAAFDFDAPSFFNDNPDVAEYNKQHRMDLLLGSSSGLNTAVVYIALLTTLSVPIFGGSLVAIFAYATGFASGEVMNLVGTLYGTSLSTLVEHEHIQWAWGAQFTEVMSPAALGDFVNATASGTFEINGSSYFRRAAALFLVTGMGLSIVRWGLAQILQLVASVAQRTCCKKAIDGHHVGHVQVDIGTCNDTAILYERFEIHQTIGDGDIPPATKALQDVVEQNRKSIDKCLNDVAGLNLHWKGLKHSKGKKLQRQGGTLHLKATRNPVSNRPEAANPVSQPNAISRKNSSGQDGTPKSANQKRYNDVMSKNALGLDRATLEMLQKTDKKNRDGRRRDGEGAPMAKAAKERQKTDKKNGDGGRRDGEGAAMAKAVKERRRTVLAKVAKQKRRTAV